MTELNLKNTIEIGSNKHGYTFCAAQLEDGKWVGFAKGGGALFFFHQVSEGHQLGVKDRDYAILLTGAIAEDPESAYGGVEVWNVPPDLRGKPEDFRCERCDQIGCKEDDCCEYDDLEYP